MIERGGGLGFLEEALSIRLLFRHMRGQEFEGDESVERQVLGLVDNAHAPAAEFLQDLVVADGFADHDRSILPLYR